MAWLLALPDGSYRCRIVACDLLANDITSDFCSYKVTDGSVSLTR